MSDCRASLRSVYVHLSRSVIRLMAVFGTAELEVMLMNIGAILILLCMFPGHIFAAVPRRSISDEQVVAQAQLAASGVYAEVYQHGVVVEPSFLKIMESAYEEVRRVTGLRLDTATLGSMVRVYVSNALGVSHVWKAYQHPSDPGVLIFLILRAYHGAMAGKNATQIFPGAAVGPNAEGNDRARRNLAPEIIEHLGTTKPAPEWVSTDPSRRSDYYFANYRLVNYLVESKGLENFWKLYASENPEVAIKSLYGLDRKEAVEAALEKK